MLSFPQILMLIFQQMFISCSQSFTYFFPTIVKTLGYGPNETLLLTAPPYLFAFFCSVAVAYSSSRFEERGLHIAIPMVGQILPPVTEYSHSPLGYRRHWQCSQYRAALIKFRRSIRVYVYALLGIVLCL